METLSDSGKWTWTNIMDDLKEQGGLPGVTINPLTMNPNGCGGQTEQGTGFAITWIKDLFMLISLTKDEPELIEAFSKVLEYKPFCKYINCKNLLTYEWDKKDPEGRFLKLQKNNEISLQRIN